MCLMWRQLPVWLSKYGRNFYAVTAFLFLIWMLFFDSNDFVSQFQNWSRLDDAMDEREYYAEKIKQVQAEREQLLNNNQLLEKFAREKYLMKRPNEDIYIVVEQD